MRNRRIVLVNPCLPTIAKEVVSTPFGLAWISAVLKREGYVVEALDMQVEPSFQRLREQLTPQPLAIGVAHVSNFSMGWSGEVIKFIREEIPEAFIFAGGVGATYEPERVLRENNASVVVLGEAEKTVVELIRQADRNGGRFDPTQYSRIKGLGFLQNGSYVTSPRQDPIHDLDELPLPDKSIFNLSLYPQMALITSRGCSHACAFCSSAHFWEGVTGRGNARVRLRSSSNVLSELEELWNRYNIDRFYVLDDIFTYDENRTMEICQGMLDRGMKFKWGCQTRADQVTPRLLKLMKASGCESIHYGLESANNESLRKMSKGITAEQISQAILWTRENGIRVRNSVIIGLPHDTASEVRETIDFLEKHRPNEVQLYALMPYPGSKWGNNLKKYGLNILQPDSNKRVQSVYEPFAETELLSRDEIMSLADEAVARLVKLGFVHLTGREKDLKQGYEHVVSSSFTPIQVLEKYANVSSYSEILQMGPLPYTDAN